MRINHIRWARLCVSALPMTVLACSAKAGETHKLQPGETLASLARRYGVSIKDITTANHLTNQDSVDQGRVLTIPDAPRPVTVAETMSQAARVRAEANRISVRIGPGAQHRRLAMFDAGAPMTVTAQQDGWAQVRLPDGRSGWIRQDFLTMHGNAQIASSAPVHRGPAHRHFAPVQAVAEDRRRRRARQIARAGEHMARKHHERQHPVRLARSARRHPRAIQVAHWKRHHTVQMAATHRRSRRGMQVAQWGRRHFGRWSRRGRYVPEAPMPAATNDVVRTAYAYRGTPYVWGGSSRGGFDCSGFTSYLYRQKGVSLPHSASAQFHHGTRVGRGELKPGDLVFFETVHKGISHVGMYVGNGRFVHASSRRSGGVRVDSLQSGYYNERFRGARRVAK